MIAPKKNEAIPINRNLFAYCFGSIIILRLTTILTQVSARPVQTVVRRYLSTFVMEETPKWRLSLFYAANRDRSVQ